MPTLLTYHELGAVQKAAGSIREDLMDFLEILSPAETPLFSNIGSLKVNAGFVEYLEDTLSAAAVNAYPEGAAVTSPTLATPTRNASLVQNFQKHWVVSAREEAVLHAAVPSMIAHQEMKAMKEIKTDIELALTRGSAVTGTTTTAAMLKGILNAASTYATSSSGTTLTESVFNSLLAVSFATPTNLREGYVNMNLKRTINQYTTSVQRYLPASERRTMDIIDVYESEMGVIALFKHRYQLMSASLTTYGNSLMVIDPDFFQVGWLRPIKSVQAGIAGDYTQKFLVGECTLIVRSEKAAVVGLNYVAYVR